MKNLPIPKNHNQRMYKFGYDTARENMIEEFEKMIDKYKKQRLKHLKVIDFGKETYISGKYDAVLEMSEELKQWLQNIMEKK